MRTVAADFLAWVFLAMIVGGLVGGCGVVAYAQWFGGLDTGAPFSFLAGIRMLGFMVQHPPVLLLFAIGAIGVFGLLLIAPYTTSRKKAPSVGQTRDALAAAQSLTTAYSKILQTSRDHFWPLSSLPADKETMKAALKMDAAFQASQGELDMPVKGEQITTPLRQTYISAYAMLADFVPDDLAARVNPYWKFIKTEGERVTSGEQTDGMALAQGLTKIKPSEDDERECQKARDEWTTLGDEMRAYLDRIAPRGRQEGGAL